MGYSIEISKKSDEKYASGGATVGILIYCIDII